MSTVNKKKYRHSSSFYRRLKRLKKTNQSEGEVLNECEELLHDQNHSLHHEELPTTSTYENGNQISNDGSTNDHQHSTTDETKDDDGGDSIIRTTTPDSEFSSSEEENIRKDLNLLEDLKKWALIHKLTISSLSDLLKILNDHGLKVPNDGRALLKNPLSVGSAQMKSMGTGTFWYNGIKKNLINVLSSLPLEKISLIELLFNVDGMSPFNSAASEVWPITFSIFNMPEIKPMYAAIYYGVGKPPLDSYLREFVDELNELLINGLDINERNITIKIKCFICDTPARSFLKGTPYFNSGKSSCIKCMVDGVWDKKGRHMSYPMFNCRRRTDSDFRNQVDEDHHVRLTPLIELPIDMVEDFIVADSLHLLDLGIMRKCLQTWCKGSANFETKLRGSDIDLLNEMLKSSEETRPKEIQRNIRGVKFLKYWKGTEYRVMLLYLGFVVLKDVLKDDVYEHFLLLSCAVTILSCKTYSKYIDIAVVLIDEYLEGCINIYGIDSISSNFHNLCHIVEDVKKFGCLPSISSYPFESSLGQLKSLVRSGKQPLTQIANWVTKLSLLTVNLETPNKLIYLRGEKGNTGFYRRIYFRNFMLGDDKKNSWFMTKQNTIVKMHSVCKSGKIFRVNGAPLENTADLFTTPFKSSKLNIYISKGVYCKDSEMFTYKLLHPNTYLVEEIKCKLFFLRYKTDFVFFPLLHTLDELNLE